MAPPAPPIVSVLIPTYNGAATLAETLASVFAQSFADFEVIVIDDGSTDATPDVLAAAGDSRLRVVRQPNAGISAARNRGIAEARGEFIALLDHDDLWPADKLAWQVAALQADPAAVMAYGWTEQFGEGGGPAPIPHAPAGEVGDAFLRHNWIASPGQTLIRADALRTVGGFDPTLWGADDWDLYVRLAAAGPFVYQPKIALLYRIHATNSSRDWRRMRANLRAVRRKHLGVAPMPWNLGRWLATSRSMSRYLAGEMSAMADRAERDGDAALARRLWRQVVWVRPSLLHLHRTRRNLLRSLMPADSSGAGGS